MVAKIDNSQFNYWRTLFEKIKEAHADSDVALRDDLKQEFDTASAAFQSLVNQYKELRAKEKLSRKLAGTEKKKAQQAIDRIRYALISQVEPEKVPTVLQSYDLDRRGSNSRENILIQLRQIKDALGRQDILAKPPAELVTELDAAFTALATKLSDLDAVAADLEAGRRQLAGAIKTNRQVRDRIHAYLISVLPQRSQDPTLMDYGLRASFSTGERRVRVVTDAETATTTNPAQPVATS